MIIDAHTHVSATDFGSVETLLRQLDAAGIDQAVCVPGGMIDVRQFSRLFTGQYKPNQEIPNHLVYDAIKNHPDRMHGFVCINPLTGPAALDMLKEGFDRGCRGVKLAPLVHGFLFKEPVLQDVAALCGQRGFPVYTHVVPKPGATTGDFAALARQFPGTNFILGHMGFGPADVDAIEFAAELDNFYLESSLGNWLIQRDALAKFGSKKLLFGSEFPLSHPQVELQKILLLDEACREDVTCRNVQRLLGL